MHQRGSMLVFLSFSYFYFAFCPTQGSLGLSGPSGDAGSKGEMVMSL